MLFASIAHTPVQIQAEVIDALRLARIPFENDSLWNKPNFVELQKRSATAFPCFAIYLIKIQ